MFIDPGVEVHCGSATGTYSTLIATALGALIGFAGSFGTTWYSNRLSRTGKAQRAREDRIRELYEAVGLYEETFNSAVREINRKIPIEKLSRDEADLFKINLALGRKIFLLSGPEFPAVRKALAESDKLNVAFKDAFFVFWGKQVGYGEMAVLFRHATQYSESLKALQAAVYEALHGPGSSAIPD